MKTFVLFIVAAALVGCTTHNTAVTISMQNNRDGIIWYWIPAGAGQGPPLSRVQSLELMNGKHCDYAHDEVGKMLGLWCEQGYNE